MDSTGERELYYHRFEEEIIEIEKFNLDVFCGFLKERKYSSEFFDVVTLWHVLEHIPQPLDELLEIHRIIKPDGLLVVDIPILADLNGKIRIKNC